MVVISVHECPPEYRSVLFSLFDNQIDITAVTKEPNKLQVKVSCSNLHHNRHVDGRNRSESYSFVITESELKSIPAR